MLDEYKYPFLKRLEDEITRRFGGGVKISDILDSKITKLAKERLDLIRKDLELPSYKSYGSDSIFVFYTLIILLSLIKNEKLKEKFSDRESEHFIKALSDEPEDSILEYASRLSVPVNVEPISIEIIENKKKKIKVFKYYIDFINYIKFTKKTKDKKLRLYNQIVFKGHVYLNKDLLLRVLKHVTSLYLKSLIKPLPDVQDIDRIREKLGIKIKKIIPPCMEFIRDKINKEGKISEEELKTYIVFLIDIGHSNDSIRIQLQKINNDKINDIIKYYRKRKYIVYSCNKMKELNMCVQDCGVTNPLELYYV
jgi:DNA primase large subunit